MCPASAGQSLESRLTVQPGVGQAVDGCAMTGDDLVVRPVASSEMQASFSRRRAWNIASLAIVFGLFAVWLVMPQAVRETLGVGNPRSPYLLFLVGWVFARLNWRCPVCTASLSSWALSPEECSNCHVIFRRASR